MPRAPLVIVIALLVGCGGDGEPAATSKPNPKPAASTPDQERSNDEQAVAEVAQKYLRGFSEKDFEALCETRTEKEQKELARTAGSCPKAFEAIIKEKPAVTKLFEQAEIGEVKVAGEKATAEIVQKGQTEPVDTLKAVKETDGWALVSG